MLCQNCGKNEATTHLKRIINGEASEAHLCSECAAKLGYGNIFSGFNPFDLSIGNFLGDFFEDSVTPKIGYEEVTRCDKCGCSFDDIVNTGKVGCANCYTTFFDRLLPSFQRIHGKTRHIGKIGAIAGPKAKAKSNLAELKRQLNAAVEAQNYEEAAKLRDRIKEMEKKEDK